MSSSLYMAQSFLRSFLIRIGRNGSAVLVSSSTPYSSYCHYRFHPRSFICQRRNQGDGMCRRITAASDFNTTSASDCNSTSSTAGGGGSNGNTGDSDDGRGCGGRELLTMSDEKLMSQCEMDTFKVSGPGGQHRNKRESAVRLKHLPTGIVAQASEDRSQHKNRASALARLRNKLALKGIQLIWMHIHLLKSSSKSFLRSQRSEDQILVHKLGQIIRNFIWECKHWWI
ncbi:uncharacterized protein LOC131311366 isoform X2 [Rhododendron vialii]|uniref:uncharacterized protein LOC131311366 isoform X2 n=1 Tax=Rhododendron vialii TaxID=182163 RepID=UPI00265E4128|nr:uncharacterized protein LOC131311366 isoform X2 [Rhododendron vialii]